MTAKIKDFFKGFGIFIFIFGFLSIFIYMNARIIVDRNNKIALDSQKKMQVKAVKAGVATWVVAEDGSTTFAWIKTNNPTLEK